MRVTTFGYFKKNINFPINNYCRQFLIATFNIVVNFLLHLQLIA